jgi:hypothetical protein
MTAPRRLLLALLLLAVSFGVRAPYLQRTIWNIDEGITITASEQILAGGVLYRDAADHRNPLVPYLKAGIFAVFGDWNTAALHCVLAVLLGLGAIALWQLARRLGDERTGVAAALVFTLLCFALPDDGDAMAAHTEWFLILFSLAGFWAFACALERPGFLRGIGPGMLFGLALLCKQPGLFDLGTSLVLVALLLLSRPGQRGALLRFALGELAGLALVLGATLAYFAYHGAAADLLYYAWTYNSTIYVPAIPLPARLATMIEPFRLAALHTPAVLVAGLLGACLLLVSVGRGLCRRPALVSVLPWLALGWSAAGILAASLGGRGFSHYSIQVIPGLSLAAGWLLARAWEWFSAGPQRRRHAGLAVLLLALAATGWRLAERFREISPRDNNAIELCQIVRDFTLPQERIFVWGFAPDYYVYCQRLPNTRFLHTLFLTGMIAWTNLDPLTDTSATVTPGSWERLREDFQRTPAAMIVDTGPVCGHAKYPLRDRPQLWGMITREYAEVEPPVRHPLGLRFYRRLAPAESSPPPLGALADPTVSLTVGYTNQYPAIPTLTARAPRGATRLDLYAGGLLLRTLALPATGRDCDVTFFAPVAERPPGATVFRAALHQPDGVRLGPPVEIPAAADLLRSPAAAGPPLRLRGKEYPPLGSEAHLGPPTPRTTPPETWLTHAIAKLVYVRPAGLKSLSFTYGMDEQSYYDTAASPASDGVDFVVGFEPATGDRTRLFSRRLEPKGNGADHGPQTSEIVFPDSAPGAIVVQVLPGRNGSVANDTAYLGPLLGTAGDFGPPLLHGSVAIPAEAVGANRAPVMTCDPEGKWTAHSPSTVSYELPASARSLTFGYGLEPASYDGSQGGRTDGISIIVTAELADGTTATLFERNLDPVNAAADRGRQTACIDISSTQVRRVTLAIGPGPRDNYSFDWSYLADLRAYDAAPLPGPNQPATAAPSP